MKNPAFLTLFCLLVFNQLFCQNVIVPDIWLKERLIAEGVDTNNDGEISFAEAEVVESLDISYNFSGLFIEDLTGLEAFVNLDTLLCHENYIVSLQPLENLPLKYLDCEWNHIESLSLNTSLLSYLNINYNNLESLNAGLFPDLKKLYCNPSENLIINNPLLEELLIESVIPVNTSMAPALIKLQCKPSSPPDLQNNTELEILVFSSPYGAVTSIDLSTNTKLNYLFIWCNLTTIDLSSNTELTYINLLQNELISLDLSNNILLEELICFNNELTSLDLSNNFELIEVKCFQNEIYNLNVSNLSKLENLYCGHNNLEELDLSDNLALKRLDIYKNSFQTIDLSNNPNLDYFDCADNGMAGPIDFSFNPELTYVEVNDNLLTELDFSNNLKMDVIWCQNNQLTNINISNLELLTELHFFSNNFEYIDFSDNIGMGTMQCGSNPMDSMDLSFNPNLSHVTFTNMPSLTKVCVSELPVPFNYITTGSPNVYFEVCSFTDVTDVLNNNFSIGPNPCLSHIKIYNPDRDEAKVSIFSGKGDKIKEVIMWQMDLEIDISQYPEGMYFVLIKTEKEKFAYKIIKQ